MKGPKVDVLRSMRLHDNEWSLMLACGHNTSRKVKRRREWGGVGRGTKSVEDPAPVWVYCELCRDKVKVGS
jgi:hypothetical protein